MKLCESPYKEKGFFVVVVLFVLLGFGFVYFSRIISFQVMVTLESISFVKQQNVVE